MASWNNNDPGDVFYTWIIDGNKIQLDGGVGIQQELKEDGWGYLNWGAKATRWQVCPFKPKKCQSDFRSLIGTSARVWAV